MFGLFGGVFVSSVLYSGFSAVYSYFLYFLNYIQFLRRSIYIFFLTFLFSGSIFLVQSVYPILYQYLYSIGTRSGRLRNSTIYVSDYVFNSCRFFPVQGLLYINSRTCDMLLPVQKDLDYIRFSRMDILNFNINYLFPFSLTFSSTTLFYYVRVLISSQTIDMLYRLAYPFYIRLYQFFYILFVVKRFYSNQFYLELFRYYSIKFRRVILYGLMYSYQY